MPRLPRMAAPLSRPPPRPHPPLSSRQRAPAFSHGRNGFLATRIELAPRATTKILCAVSRSRLAGSAARAELYRLRLRRERLREHGRIVWVQAARRGVNGAISSRLRTKIFILTMKSSGRCSLCNSCKMGAKNAASGTRGSGEALNETARFDSAAAEYALARVVPELSIDIGWRVLIKVQETSHRACHVCLSQVLIAWLRPMRESLSFAIMPCAPAACRTSSSQPRPLMGRQ